ncbi:hypothetical protein HS961_09120 [Comamonas piscis]|uniref:Uncharacterized protein n=1 Tax=Comamonas piscis TaxID=1562974 RepID=A0A7G5EG62_9BURK|nr:hypothetical protein [Comamonas piscis]QMV72987.1 hypothetical protein HS961_09120 [Comamonas piscis]WSO35770.1 hypothetical protein VUJ63_09145 [Comamonas piscis]
MNDIANPTLQPPQVIQILEHCRPYAEAGDLIRLHPGEEFQGDGIYALQYLLPTRTWHGLRRVRNGADGLEIEDPDGSWVEVGERRAALLLIGKVERVFLSEGEVIEPVSPTLH